MHSLGMSSAIVKRLNDNAQQHVKRITSKAKMVNKNVTLIVQRKGTYLSKPFNVKGRFGRLTYTKGIIHASNLAAMERQDRQAITPL